MIYLHAIIFDVCNFERRELKFCLILFPDSKKCNPIVQLFILLQFFTKLTHIKSFLQVSTKEK